jgi:PAS domain S-box-containing protein
VSDIQRMADPEVLGMVAVRGGFTSFAVRARQVVVAVVALGLAAASALPAGPRLTVAAAAAVSVLAPRLAPAVPVVGRFELSAVVDLLVGFLAFFVLPEVPALPVGFAMLGLVEAALGRRHHVERIIVGVAIVIELAKLPSLAGAQVEARIPWLTDTLGPRPAAFVAFAAQVVATFAVYAAVRVVFGAFRRSKQALVESESRHRVLVEALPSAALVAVGGRIRFANDAAVELLGEPGVPLVGQLVFERLPEDVVPGVRDAMAGLAAGDPPRTVEGTPVGDAASAVHISVAVAPITYDGESAVLLVVTDMSARYAAEQARRQGEARFRAAFVNTATPFILLHPDGTISDVNRAAQALLGYSRDQAVGTSLWSLVDRGEVGRFEAFAAAATAGAADHLHTEARFRAANDAVILAAVDITLVRAAGGDPSNFVVQLHDMTARHAAEQALRASEERYRQLFESLPVALYRTRPDGSIVDVNAALLDLMGYPTAASLKAIDAAAVYVDTTDRERIRQILERDGVVVGYEAEVVRADGSRVWVRDTAHLVDLGGEVFYEGALIDVTARRRVEEELRQAARRGEAVAHLGQLALESADLPEVFTETVRAAASVLGVKSVAILRREDGERFEVTQAVGWFEGAAVDDERMHALSRYAAASTRPIVVRAGSADDTQAGAAGSAAALAIGSEADLGVLVAVDGDGGEFSTGDLQFLRSVANVLAAAVDRADARSRLEALVRSKDEFIASVSHELRTPLTVIAGMAHELQDHIGAFSPDEVAELIGLVVDQSLDMRNLIEDLLVAARADIGRLAVNPVHMDLLEAVEAVLAALSPAAVQDVVADMVPTMASADPTRVRQIIRNLITNAVRYGGPRVTIESGRDGETVFVRVCDDGPGVPAGLHERIFDPYESAHDPAGQPGSVGLGLTVSRKLARLMGGDLTYRYEDATSVFELRLPGAPTEPDVSIPPDQLEIPLSWSSLDA